MSFSVLVVLASGDGVGLKVDVGFCVSCDVDVVVSGVGSLRVSPHAGSGATVASSVAIVAMPFKAFSLSEVESFASEPLGLLSLLGL